MFHLEIVRAEQRTIRHHQMYPWFFMYFLVVFFPWTNLMSGNEWENNLSYVSHIFLLPCQMIGGYIFHVQRFAPELNQNQKEGSFEGQNSGRVEENNILIDVSQFIGKNWLHEFFSDRTCDLLNDGKEKD